MHPSSAQQTQTGLPLILVLGSAQGASLLGREISRLGFEVFYESDFEQPLGSPAGMDSGDQLRRFLTQFVDKLSGSSVSRCVYPGVSRWAERPELPLICQELGLNSLTPSARVLSLFANKLALLTEADRLGIEHLALSFDPIQSVREVEQTLQSRNFKLPLVLKSLWSGTGFGVFVLKTKEDLERRFPLWLEQLRLRGGEAILFPEKYMESARRIVLPFVRFSDGEMHFFSGVDASLQSRLRRMIDFCPPPSLDPKALKKIKEWSKKLTASCGYVGLGTLEFFVDGSDVRLLGGGAHLPTGYLVWETTDAVSAVEWQLSSLGVFGVQHRRPIPEKSSLDLVTLGIRLYAEDPILQLPQPGYLQELSEKRDWVFPKAKAQLRLEVTEGSQVGPDGDGYLGSLLVTAPDRKQAMQLAHGILDEIWIAGSLQTNERFIQELLVHPFVKEGMFYAGFVDEEFLPELRPGSEIVQTVAALCDAELSGRLTEMPDARWVVGDQWAKPESKPVQWTSPPRAWETQDGPGLSGEIQLESGPEFNLKIRVCIYPIFNNKWRVRLGPWMLLVRRVAQKSLKPGQKSEHSLFALVAGRVHSVLYRSSDRIPSHEPLVVIESMGTLVPHALPVDCRVVRWAVVAEQSVRAGQELAIFEKIG